MQISIFYFKLLTTNQEALIEDIHTDIRIALEALQKTGYNKSLLSAS